MPRPRHRRPDDEPHWFTVLTYIVLAITVMLVLMAGAMRAERAAGAAAPMLDADPGQPLLQGMT